MQGLKALPVYWRVGILGGLVGFTLVSLAATLWYSDRATSAALERQQNFAQIERLALEVEIGALQMRRREKDFLLRQETRYFDAYLADSQHVSAYLDEISALDAPADIDAAIQHLIGELPVHQSTFARVVEEQTRLGLTHDTGLQGELRAAVHNVEERLAAFQDAELTVLMLMMRRHEKDFMLRGSSRYLDSFDERQAEFAALLAERDYSAEDTAEITRLMAAYSDGFHAWAAGELGKQEIVSELSRIFAGMEPDFDIIMERAREEGRAASAALDTERQRIRLLTMGIVGAIAVIAGLLCWLVSRSIAQPINALTRSMGDLADGETGQTIPATEQGGEIGQMAKAVVFFQKSLIEVERLRAEQAEADARAAEEKRRIMNEMADEFDASIGSIANDVATAAINMIASPTSCAPRPPSRTSAPRSSPALPRKPRPIPRLLLRPRKN